MFGRHFADDGTAAAPARHPADRAGSAAKVLAGAADHPEGDYRRRRAAQVPHHQAGPGRGPR